MSKPGKVLKGLCKRLGVRLTVKRGKKRVYKSVTVLKAQCKRKKKKKVKKKKVKKKKVKRKRKFGQAPFRDFLEAPPLIRQRAQQSIELEDRNDFNENPIRNDPLAPGRLERQHAQQPFVIEQPFFRQDRHRFE